MPLLSGCGDGGSRDYFPDGAGGAAAAGRGGGAAISAGASGSVAGRTASGGASGQGTAARSGSGALSGGGGVAGSGSGGEGALGPPPWQSGSREIEDFAQGTRCESVTFAEAFDAGDDVLAFVSAVHPGSTWTHAPLARWVEGASPTGFTACLREDSDYDGAHEDMRLDWLAVAASNASIMGLRAGRATAASASAATCTRVAFEPAFQAVPDVQVALDYAHQTADVDAPAAVWAEEVTASGFRACAETLQGFERPGAPFSFVWLALPASFASTRFERGRTAFPAFSDVHCTTVETSCAECDTVQLSVDHRDEPGAAWLPHDPVLAWAEEFVDGDLTLCVRETSGHDFVHHPHLSVSWLLEVGKD